MCKVDKSHEQEWYHCERFNSELILEKFAPLAKDGYIYSKTIKIRFLKSSLK